MDHFSRKARQSFHLQNGRLEVRNKDMMNAFGGYRRDIEKSYDVVINASNAAFLISTIASLGVIYIENETSRILVLSLESDALRDTIWQKYIRSKEAEIEWHSILINYFIDKYPTTRRSEELPWHLYKCERWSTLKNTLIDLRTFDIMYNKDTVLKCELLHWLILLTGGDSYRDSCRVKCSKKVRKQDRNIIIPCIDIVDEFNRSIEIWYQGVQPSEQTLVAIVRKLYMNRLKNC